MSIRPVRMIRYIPLLVVILTACSGSPEATPRITPLEATPSAIDQLEWKEYRHAEFGYGLVVPSDWLIYPYATSVLVNFGDEGRGLTSETWPEGGFKIDIYVTDNTDHLSLEDSVHKYLDDELSGISSIEEGSINNHPGLVVFRYNKERPSDKPHKTFNLLLPGGQFVTISVLPEGGWENPDIEAMLNSFAFPGEDVLIPSTPPTVGWVDLPPIDATDEITPDSAFNQQDNLLEWKEYRDERFGYGLIVPSDWQIYPTSLESDGGALVLANFGDEGRDIPSEAWPEGAFKIDIYGFENTDHLSLEDSVHKYLDDELSGISSIEEGSINNHPGLVVFRYNKERPSDKPHKTFNLLLPGGQFVTISVLPGEGWENPDIEAMLNSFAFPGEDVLIPSSPPTVGWVDLPK